jgi:hypothetical protein
LRDRERPELIEVDAKRAVLVGGQVGTSGAPRSRERAGIGEVFGVMREEFAEYSEG